MTALAISVAAMAVGAPTAYAVHAYRKREARRLKRRERRYAAARTNGKSWATLMRRDRR